MDKFDYSTVLRDGNDELHVSISISSQNCDLLHVNYHIYHFLEDLQRYLANGISSPNDVVTKFERGSML